MSDPGVKIRRRDRAYIVTVGTRMYLARGADPDHALDHIRRRYGYQLTADECLIREATTADLDLADLIGGGGTRSRSGGTASCTRRSATRT